MEVGDSLFFVYLPFATKDFHFATCNWCKNIVLCFKMILSIVKRVCYMTIGEKITKLRKEQNLTQEQFAEILKVSRQSVSKWERNDAYPDTEKLVRIGKIFGCSLDYLLKDELEQMDVNLAAAKEEAGYDKMRAGVLTYLSFPPVFGWIMGIVSLRFQKSHMKNKVQISLTILGMVFSLVCTILMMAGILLGL